ncbi:Choloylglycine hydrolase [Lactobacillus helveticus]|nr:Choloylglycine hydrolase [Lactobacillus helveticus]NRO10364.1 Choloylglycine hydrolase [Lactobacillus helveticus]NRO66349.1 Choloylglycine hydrolase [Lactobacillus helveticus]
MCSSIIFSPKDHYFGRNLDLEITFGQQVIITPRDYVFKFRDMPEIDHHYAMVGIALNAGGYPLYFDAANEKGLGMGGLNYPDNAIYYDVKEGKDNIASFEFIPWILSQAATVEEAKKLLAKISTSLRRTSATRCMYPHFTGSSQIKLVLLLLLKLTQTVCTFTTTLSAA